MLTVFFHVLIYLLALYGALTLVISMVDSVLYRINPKKGNAQMVLVVKNQEDTVEGIVRSILSSGIMYKIVSGGKLKVVDLGSTDETQEILARLKDEYGDFLDLVEENKKESIFLYGE